MTCLSVSLPDSYTSLLSSSILFWKESFFCKRGGGAAMDQILQDFILSIFVFHFFPTSTPFLSSWLKDYPLFDNSRVTLFFILCLFISPPPTRPLPFSMHNPLCKHPLSTRLHLLLGTLFFLTLRCQLFSFISFFFFI